MKQLWLGAAVEYALEHGIATLSLRPLAAALGTSDRMLLYHFGTKDQLVVDILRSSNDRSVALVDAQRQSSGGIGQAVIDLWRLMLNTSAGRCYGLYIEASAMGLLAREPYRSSVSRSNQQWSEALARYFARAEVPASVIDRIVTLVDAAFMGFLLDMPLDESSQARDKAVSDLAHSVAVLAVSAE